MNVFESIMQGLNEAVAYEKGDNTSRSASITVTPPPEASVEEVQSNKASDN